MDKCVSLKDAINVFTESLVYSPTKEFKPYKHVVSCDYYPHSVELRKKLINEGFVCSDIKPTCDQGPFSISQVECPFDVMVDTKEHLTKLRELLDSGVYKLVEY